MADIVGNVGLVRVQVRGDRAEGVVGLSHLEVVTRQGLADGLGPCDASTLKLVKELGSGLAKVSLKVAGRGGGDRGAKDLA